MALLRRMRWFCRCGGTGIIVTRGERIPFAELSPIDQADTLVQGLQVYRKVETPCPTHGKSS